MLVYKILRADEWAAMQAAGELEGTPIDQRDGFIHLSSAEQAEATAALHFQGESDLWLLAVPVASLGEALRWEPSRGGASFPHLYRALRIQEVQWCQPLPLGQGGHEFPDGWRNPQD
jgi:uncharacterized protein (DUF952 family)